MIILIVIDDWYLSPIPGSEVVIYNIGSQEKNKDQHWIKRRYEKVRVNM